MLLSISASAQTKCEANINGYRIHNIYVMGGQYNAVVWAYKHLSECTCLTPILDATKADAILELYNREAGRPQQPTGPLTVSCSSTRNTSTCTDSDGNMMTTTCDSSGCSSYYGPDPAQAIGQAIHAWISNASYEAEANLYTSDHKLLWRSTDQKGATLWYDKLRLGTNSPGCDGRNWSVFKDAHKYKTYRRWASEQCNIEMPQQVDIDIKALDKKNAAAEKDREKQEMLDNAKAAAAKQQEHQ